MFLGHNSDLEVELITYITDTYYNRKITIFFEGHNQRSKKRLSFSPVTKNDGVHPLSNSIRAKNLGSRKASSSA